MQQASGSRWQITTDTSGPMMIALCTSATLQDWTVPGTLRSRTPSPRSALPTTATSPPMSAVCGALKTEWEAWWEQLLKAYPHTSPDLSPPDFEAFGNSPALQRVLQAHFGSALTWARERRSEYAELEAEREANGADHLLTDMVDDRLHGGGPRFA